MAWLAGGYSKRKPITVTGGASGAQTDFQLKLNTVYDADMQADFDDLRFTQANGTTLIDAWLESKVNSDSAVVWAEFPTTPANTVEQTYYMYYGNAGAASDWDIGATFVFGDDFPGAALDAGKWDGSASVSGGEATIAGAASYISTKGTYPGGYASRVKAKGIGTGTRLFLDGFAVSGNTAVNKDFTAGIYYYTNHTDFEYNSGDGTNFAYASYGVALDNNYHIFDIKRTGTADVFNLDDGANKSGSFPSNRGWYYRLYSHFAAGSLVVDWALIRKYVANPPTYAFGAEESAPVGGAAPTSIFYGPFVGPLGGPL